MTQLPQSKQTEILPYKECMRESAREGERERGRERQRDRERERERERERAHERESCCEFLWKWNRFLMDIKSASVCISLQRPCGFGEEMEALVRRGEKRRGEERRGEERKGEERRGEERRGKEKRGKEKRGEERRKKRRGGLDNKNRVGRTDSVEPDMNAKERIYNLAHHSIHRSDFRTS